MRLEWAIIMAALGVAPGMTQAIQGAEPPVTCPAIISDKLSIQRSFERPSVLNIDRRGREYGLAPDGERKTGNTVVQTWDLDAYREMRIFLRCHYRDTAALFSIELPATVKLCAFRYKTAPNGSVTGPPEFSCR